MPDSRLYERYQRQIILSAFGQEGQQKLLQAKVLVIGSGGLGCPVLQYLTAAGVGTLGIVDDDVVALSNLHRQVLYSVNDIGCLKAESAAKTLGNLNPEIEINAYPVRLTNENALDLFAGYDIIIDGSDNFATRYLVNDACVLLGKPLIYGAVSQFEGQVSVFNHTGSNNETAVNYRDIFPDPPEEEEVLNCAEAGVLGILPGIIGTMMANETIKMITGLGELLSGQLLTYNALTNQVYILGLTAAEDTRTLIPSDKEAFLKTDYVWLCSSSPELEIGSSEFDALLAREATEVIDVREPEELPEVNEFITMKIPLAQLKENTGLLKSDRIIFICQSGKRSLQAARMISGIFGQTKKVYSLKGGIIQWKKQHQLQ